MTRQTKTVAAGATGGAGSQGNPGASGITEIAIGFGGGLVVISSGRYYAPVTGTTVTVNCNVGTTGTSNTVWTIKKNGVAIGTVTAGPGVNKPAAVVFTTAFTLDTDYFTAEITTVGTGAADATTQLRLT